MSAEYRGRVSYRRPSTAGPISRILGLSLLHLAAAFLAALLAHGVDLDQLRSRSAVSRSAAVVHDVLWFPHDPLVRALPPEWLAAGAPVVLGAMAVSSLAWGITLYALWRLGLPPLRRASARPRAAGAERT